jgi:hypothetical protein
MNEPTFGRMKEWVEAYKAALIALEEHRRHHLQTLTDREALWISDALLSIPPTGGRREASSGLVEQQAIFRRWRDS